MADEGYDADAIRVDLASRNIKAVIPGRSNRLVKIEHDRVLYKQRNRIERMFGWLKINRAIATRYDQLANSFMGMVHIATARYWLKFVHVALGYVFFFFDLPFRLLRASSISLGESGCTSSIWVTPIA